MFAIFKKQEANIDDDELFQQVDGNFLEKNKLHMR
jgi:hypothetical protein